MAGYFFLNWVKGLRAEIRAWSPYSDKYSDLVLDFGAGSSSACLLVTRPSDEHKAKLYNWEILLIASSIAWPHDNDLIPV